MIHKINDIRKELARVLERMEVGDTAEAPCEGKNVGYVRSFATNINRGYTSKGQRRFKTSTYRCSYVQFCVAPAAKLHIAYVVPRFSLCDLYF